MRKTITLFIPLFVKTMIAVSQPTISISNHISMGTYYSTYMVDAGFTPGTPGQNQVWNFQSIIPKTPLYYDTVDVIPAVGTYFDSLFPSANFAINAHAWKVYNNRYNYYNVNGSKVDWLGSVDSVYRISIICSDPLTELQVPLNFNSSFSDSYADSYSPQGPWNRGSVNVLYDSYGTLHLPNGIINNAYRITTQQLLIDSNSTRTDTFNILNINWYDPAKNYPVLYFKQSFFHGSLNGQWLYYNTSFPFTGTDELISDKPYFKLYPNPVGNSVWVDFNKSISGTISIFDAMGKEIVRENFNKEASHEIITSELTTGVYFIQVTSESGTSQQKIIKQE